MATGGSVMHAQGFPRESNVRAIIVGSIVHDHVDYGREYYWGSMGGFEGALGGGEGGAWGLTGERGIRGRRRGRGGGGPAQHDSAPKGGCCT